MPPQLQIVIVVPSDQMKTDAGEHRVHLVLFRRTRRDSQRHDSFERCALRGGEQRGSTGGRVRGGDLFFQMQERPMSVDCRPLGVGAAEYVVEDLERPRSVVTGGVDMLSERIEIEAALPREVSVMPAPLEDVHRQERSVRQLEEEDLLAGNLANSGGIVTAREDVKAVQTGTERRMVDALDDLPRMAVRVDVGTPRERLIGNLLAVLGRQFGESSELLCQLTVIVTCGRQGRGAHQERLAPQLIHELEFALHSNKIPSKLGLVHRVEVTERLIQIEGQAQIRSPRS